MGLNRGQRCNKVAIKDEPYCERHDQRKSKYHVMFDDFLEYQCLIDPSKTPWSLYGSCKDSVRLYSKCGSSDEREIALDDIAQFLFSKDWYEVTPSDLAPFSLNNANIIRATPGVSGLTPILTWNEPVAHICPVSLNRT